jgi:NAD-dependent deacetylase
MNLQAAADALQTARHVCILTGAGASAESGVPTFREALTGLWEQYDPLDLATPEAFQRDPKLVWKWYCWRRELVAKASPNAGHYALAALAQKVRTLTLITQNVDGLHQRAGSDSVIEYHGNLFENRCFAGNCDVSAADLSVASPSCPHCGARIRPGVVWFGEAIPGHAMQAASLAAGDCDVFLSIGTSSMVWPAAGLAEIAQANGATVVEINPDATASTRPDHYAIAGESGVILPRLLAMLGA